VVLEYSTDKDMMLPGQTGPTITKWFNKECSLVDIPGNCNALSSLYDANENVLNLLDLNIGAPVLKTIPQNLLRELRDILKTGEDTDENGLTLAVQDLAKQTEKLALENKSLWDEKKVLLSQIESLNHVANKYEINALLDRALEDKRITIELRNKLAVDYASNTEGLKGLLSAMPAYRCITELLKSRQQDKTEAQWEWDDFEKNDAAGKKLKELKANDPVRYKELFDRKFNG
jgi:hypothetical protein